MKITGPSCANAESISPPASAGVEGTTLVLATVAVATTTGRSQHQWGGPFAAGESFQLGCMVEQRIHGNAQKINHI